MGDSSIEILDEPAEGLKLPEERTRKLIKGAEPPPLPPSPEKDSTSKEKRGSITEQILNSPEKQFDDFLEMYKNSLPDTQPKIIKEKSIEKPNVIKQKSIEKSKFIKQKSIEKSKFIK